MTIESLSDLQVTPELAPPPPAMPPLLGRFEIHNVDFGTLETAFFERYVWNQWTPLQRRLTDAARVAASDMTLSAAIQTNYMVESHPASHTELFSIFPLGEDEQIALIGFSNRLEVKMDGPLRSTRELLGVYDQWAAQYETGKYGTAAIDFQFATFKIRQILIGIQGAAEGHYKLIDNQFVMKLWPVGDQSDFALVMATFMPSDPNAQDDTSSEAEPETPPSLNLPG